VETTNISDKSFLCDQYLYINTGDDPETDGHYYYGQCPPYCGAAGGGLKPKETTKCYSPFVADVWHPKRAWAQVGSKYLPPTGQVQ
jgi:hypothetical protein